MTRSAPNHYQAPDLNQARFNRETSDALGHILTRAGVDYDLVSLTVGTSATQVPHRLTRQWQGWTVVDIAANTNIWRSTPPSGAAAGTLWVQAGTSAAVILLVF